MTSELKFSLELLASAAELTPPLTACPDGHLQVKGRSCWKPTRFSEGLTAVYCTPVDHDRGEQ